MDLMIRITPALERDEVSGKCEEFADHKFVENICAAYEVGKKTEKPHLHAVVRWLGKSDQSLRDWISKCWSVKGQGEVSVKKVTILAGAIRYTLKDGDVLIRKGWTPEDYEKADQYVLDSEKEGVPNTMKVVEKLTQYCRQHGCTGQKGECQKVFTLIYEYYYHNKVVPPGDYAISRYLFAVRSALAGKKSLRYDLIAEKFKSIVGQDYNHGETEGYRNPQATIPSYISAQDEGPQDAEEF